jgi:CheY-like chemotaxis protein
MLISVVDDDEAIRDSTRQLLRSAGYHVATFDSAESFLDSRSIEGSSCLILDIKMSGIDGLELQRRLKDSGRTAPIIFVTAHHQSSIRKRAIEAGAADFLDKPFESRTLLAAVDRALTSAAARSETYIIYVGQDNSYRPTVLRNAGYRVRLCTSEKELVRSLEIEITADLICVSQEAFSFPYDVLTTARTNWHAPVILFRNASPVHSGFKFDLEIESLTLPSRWLRDVANILATSNGRENRQLFTAGSRPKQARNEERT